MSSAIAQIKGEIANDLKVTSGGLCMVNVLVHYEGPRGPIPNYLPIRFFRPESDKVYGSFKKGDEVQVVANLKMNKPQGAQYYQVNIVGESIKLVEGDLVSKIKREFDATLVNESDLSDVTFGNDDDIPFA